MLSGLKKIESLKSIINNLREVKDLKTSLNFAQENIAQLQKGVAKTTTTVDEHSDDLDSMDADIEALKRRNIKLEAYTRRKNMRIYNIIEEPEEQTEEVVRNLLTNQMQIPSQVVKAIRFERVHRIPSVKPKQATQRNPRPIISGRHTQDTVSSLEKSETGKKKGFLNFDKLIIDGQIYRGKESKKLPYYGNIMKYSL